MCACSQLYVYLHIRGLLGVVCADLLELWDLAVLSALHARGCMTKCITRGAEFLPGSRKAPPLPLSHSCLPSPVLQELQGPQPPAGREFAGLHSHSQGKASEEEGAQAEDHPHQRRCHRAGAAEQGPGRAVAQGQ